MNSTVFGNLFRVATHGKSIANPSSIARLVPFGMHAGIRSQNNYAVIPVSDADVAEYEQEHPAVRQFTQKLMAQMSPDDAASVLVNAFEKDQPPMSKQMAEAIVRIVSAEMAAAQPLKNPALGAVVSRAAKARELTSLLGLEVQPDAGKLFNLLHITEEQIRAIAATGCLKDYEYVEPV